MNLIYGSIMLAVAAGMVLFGRPRRGKSPAFLGSWIVGQVYVLSAMVGFVLGIALIIVSLKAT